MRRFTAYLIPIILSIVLIGCSSPPDTCTVETVDGVLLARIKPEMEYGYTLEHIRGDRLFLVNAFNTMDVREYRIVDNTH